jgi:hypothetical protein
MGPSVNVYNVVILPISSGKTLVGGFPASPETNPGGADSSTPGRGNATSLNVLTGTGPPILKTWGGLDEISTVPPGYGTGVCDTGAGIPDDPSVGRETLVITGAGMLEDPSVGRETLVITGAGTFEDPSVGRETLVITGAGMLDDPSGGLNVGTFEDPSGGRGTPTGVGIVVPPDPGL